MPKRTKIPPAPDYSSIGRTPGNHMIQKSDPLLSLSKTDMTLPELKILDAYLDRINSHDPEKRTVQFERGAIEKFLGVSRLLQPDLEKRLSNLAQMVRIEDENKPNGFQLVCLFESLRAWQDEDGLWQITLTCTPSAREYIFNVENIHYLRYALSDVISLTSRYSYFLYLYLLKNRWRKTWEISLDNLKEYLRCTAETYQQFKRFNDLVLKKCQKELISKTSLEYSYQPIKKGRVVKAIRFDVVTQTPIESPEMPEQLSISDLDDPVEFLSGAVTPARSDQPEFNRAELEQLFQALAMLPDYKLPCNSDELEFRRYHYLAERYAALNRQHAKKPIKHRFAYLLKLIKIDSAN